MPAQYDLAETLLKAPRDCWIALDQDQSKIVGRGATLAQAVEEARENGVDDPVVFWRPKTWAPATY